MTSEHAFTGDEPTEELLRLVAWTCNSLQTLRDTGSNIPPEVDLMFGIQQGMFHNLVDAIVQRYERELVQLERVMQDHYNDKS